MQAEIVFNGLLAFLSLVLIIYISAIVIQYAYLCISDLYFRIKTRKDRYRLGYADGYADGLLKANKLMKELLAECQEKIDSLIAYEGEEE